MPNIPLNRNTITRFCNSYAMIFGRRATTAEADEQWKGEKCLSTMRQSFHRALTTCKAPLPPGKKYVAVQFLTKELLFYVVDAKGKGQEVFDEASKHLGLIDAELFGLAFYQDGEYIFIDLNLKVSKYAVRSWKTHSNGIGGDGHPLLILHMRIKYYVDCHLLINEKVVRHHYYLQLRENVKNYSQPLSEEKSFVLAALALQADLGNFSEEKHKNRYFEIGNYFPPWIIKKIGEEFIIKNIPALHKDNAGLSRGEAQVGYIKEASDVTAPHNLHFYKMRRKKGKVICQVFLGISDSGIHIYEFLQKKKFEILSEGSPDYRRFTYFVQSEELAKHLLWICRTTHHFHMANQGRVADLKKLELDGGKPYREAYIYTDKYDQAQEKKQNTIPRCRSKSKIENSTINLNGIDVTVDNSQKSNAMKMTGVSWTNENGLNGVKLDDLSTTQHHSMEVLPLLNGSKFSSDLKYKSQSIPCFTDHSLAPYSEPGHNINSNQMWSPSSKTGTAITTPSSTLMSRSSCTSNTDSNCSSLSLTSGSTLKVGSLTSKCSNDGNRWVKCDSFEELPVKNSTENIPQKLCISTFVDKHVRTASVYNAVTPQRSNIVKSFPATSGMYNFPNNAQPSLTNATSLLIIPTTDKPTDVRRTPSFNVCSDSVQNKHLMKSPYKVKAKTTVTKRTPSFNAHAVDSPSKTPSYASLSLEPPVSMKKIDVKRTPSLNLCAVQPDMKSETLNQTHLHLQTSAQHRRYTVNAQTPHSRAVTRIGVSSLNRDQRLPLTLYNDRQIIACGSEPNLYIPVNERSPTRKLGYCDVSKSQYLQRHLNSRSEMNLNVIDYAQQNQNGLISPHGEAVRYDYDFRNRQLSLPDVCSDILEADFPCIPPPPAYRNDIVNGGSVAQLPNLEFIVSSNTNMHNNSVLNSNISQLTEKRKELRKSPTRPDVLDIHQLRQRSRDLDLPLISALCNDRSLLMLPKTVPTCSRQRHLGTKDPMRFNRTTSLPNGDGMDTFLVNAGRPMSWHVDASHVPQWTQVTKPCSASWDNTITSYSPQNTIESPLPSSLPPTILTSFVNTPVKQYRYTRDRSNSSDSYRYDKNQMIPTKLLSGPLGGIQNTRLYPKGLSS
nr:uncharacterized protein LOC107452647 [Parasteatoda tepidariorum]